MLGGAAPETQPIAPLTRNRLYRITEFIGRWSMVDVFVVAINGRTDSQWRLNILLAPGPAALAFTSVVILTMLAAMMFDPRSIWQANASNSDSLVSSSVTSPKPSIQEQR